MTILPFQQLDKSTGLQNKSISPVTKCDRLSDLNPQDQTFLTEISKHTSWQAQWPGQAFDTADVYGVEEGRV